VDDWRGRDQWAEARSRYGPSGAVAVVLSLCRPGGSFAAPHTGLVGCCFLGQLRRHGKVAPADFVRAFVRESSQSAHSELPLVVAAASIAS
jgi:hypothetical protein